ncbi:MAG: hypothetical protein AB8B79_07785 [Granulosicoccus sp.]
MSRFVAFFLITLPMMAGSHAWAQDLLGSTGSTTRSYSYFEVQYLPELDTDLPLLANLVVDITDSISVRAEYLKQASTLIDAGTGLEIDFDGEALSLGLLYHQPLAAIADSDWVAGLSFGRVRVEGSFANGLFNVETSDDFQEAYAGIRRTLSDKVEGEAGITAFRILGDTDFTGDLRIVFRVRPSVDVALALNEIGEGDLFGIGFRYTW